MRARNNNSPEMNFSAPLKYLCQTPVIYYYFWKIILFSSAVIDSKWKYCLLFQIISFSRLPVKVWWLKGINTCSSSYYVVKTILFFFLFFAKFNKACFSRFIFYLYRFIIFHFVEHENKSLCDKCWLWSNNEICTQKIKIITHTVCPPVYRKQQKQRPDKNRK